jgi:uncharacterized membrane-anchored protein YitT (DUF2179 family)
MSFVIKEKLFSLKWFMRYTMIIVGAFILASGFVFFITPHKIIPGGVYGIAIVLHYLIGTPVGATALAFDIPLTLLGLRILGPRFGAKTVVGFVMTAVFNDGLTFIYGTDPLIKDDVLLSSIVGGVVIGVGLGLIFKAKATSGGTDIVAMILNKYMHVPVGKLLIIVDSVIVLFGLIVFEDWKIPFYSLLVIYIVGKVLDTILEGVNYDKVLFIISDKTEEIRNKIINDLNRSGTYIPSKGMFQQSDKTMIFTVVSRREMTILQDFISSVDPKAFVTVINASEILGEGFRSLKKTE